MNVQKVTCNRLHFEFKREKILRSLINQSVGIAMSYKENVMNALKSVIDPWMGIDYVTARMVKVDEAAQTVKIELGYPARHMIEDCRY